MKKGGRKGGREGAIDNVTDEQGLGLWRGKERGCCCCCCRKREKDEEGREGGRAGEPLLCPHPNQ